MTLFPVLRDYEVYNTRLACDDFLVLKIIFSFIDDVTTRRTVIMKVVTYGISHNWGILVKYGIQGA